MSSDINDAERDAEFEAMRAVDIALQRLPRETGSRERVLRWACDKYRVTSPAGSSE